MEYDCFQIELSKNYGINEWKDDLRKVMMKAGIEGQPVVFLFSDTQVMWQVFNVMKSQVFVHVSVRFEKNSLSKKLSLNLKGRIGANIFK